MKCDYCKDKITGTNYYLVKFNKKIVAHICGVLCLGAWADNEYDLLNPPRKKKNQTTLESYLE